MIVSVNPMPPKGDFVQLLDATVLSLKKAARKDYKKYTDLQGNKLESNVVDILSDNAIGTPFENSIELISGQRFPDIVAMKYYGVEVKTSKSNHWKSTGSSVAEGTRVDGVERIFMLFGKMSSPIDFKCKPYEDCLSEVVVTHSPRYLIDMQLNKGESFFDKIKIPYDDLRMQPNPIKTILSYYRKQLKDGDDIWWLEQETPKSSNLIIRIWNNLDVVERQDIMCKGLIYFPELLSNHSDKFNRFALWLSMREGVVCPNVRDIFTAGGQGNITYRDKIYKNNPQIIMKLYDNLSNIAKVMANTGINEIETFWGSSIKKTEKIDKWIELVAFNLKTIIKNELPIKNVLQTELLS